MYKIKFVNNDNIIQESPIIESDSIYRNRENDQSIPKKINKLCKSMIRNKIIKEFEILYIK